MKLAKELGKKLAEGYFLQDEYGPSYLSSLIWDAWCGLPIDPNDPIPYVETLLEGKILLDADERITQLSKEAQWKFYQAACDVMWKHVREERNKERAIVPEVQMHMSSWEIEVEILNLDGEWSFYNVSIAENGALIDRHPDEADLFPSIFIADKEGRWQNRWERLTPENAHLALKLDSPYVRVTQ